MNLRASRRSDRQAEPLGRRCGFASTGAGRVEIPPDILASMLAERLRAFASENGLEGGGQAARDRILSELQDNAVELLDLPKESKAKVRDLLEVRRIIDINRVRVKNLGLIHPDETVAILCDLRDRIKKDFLGSNGAEAPKVLTCLLPDIEREIARAREEGRFEGEVCSLHAEEGSPRSELLELARTINNIVLSDYLGEEADRYNSFMTAVVKQYVNVEFPQNLADLIEGVDIEHDGE